MNKVIELVNVQKQYPRTLKNSPFLALKGVTLDIPEGEVFGFIGPNGAGKSTTIKIITGISKPTAGTVRLFGLDCHDPQSRQRVGYVPESPSLYDYLTPLELLAMGMSLHGTRVADMKRHCMDWLVRLGLDHVANSRIKTFSKGMAQRATLAHALCIRPRLLVLDEPLSGLDPVGRREVIELLAEYRREGGTVFFSSHVLYDVERLADRFGLIHKGELLTLRSPHELTSAQADIFVVQYQSETALLEAAELLRPQQYQIDVPQAELSMLLDRITTGGGRLMGISPKTSLESVFFGVIAASALPHADSAEEGATTS